MKKGISLGVRFTVLCLVLFSADVFGTPVYSSKTSRASIEDKADILSEEDESALLAEAATFSEESGYEIRIVTTDDAGGVSASEYAENYFESLSESFEGGCYLLDLDNREYYIATYGGLIPYINDDRLGELLDNAGVMAKAGDWKGTLSSMLTDTERFYHAGILPGTVIYDEDTGEYTTYSETESEIESSEILQYNDYHYYINGDDTITIYSWDGTAGIVKIPGKIAGKMVTAIGEKAFMGHTDLKKVVIPETITTIENSAFAECTGLQSARLPKSVSSIGDYAFYGCKSLKDIEILYKVISIGKSAFDGCDELPEAIISE